MQFRLRTLLIVLALGPPLLAGLWLSSETIALVALTVIGFLLFVAVLAGISVWCAICLAAVADKCIDLWDNRSP
jgi:hypothetical protein